MNCPWKTCIFISKQNIKFFRLQQNIFVRVKWQLKLLIEAIKDFFLNFQRSISYFYFSFFSLKTSGYSIYLCTQNPRLTILFFFSDNNGCIGFSICFDWEDILRSLHFLSLSLFVLSCYDHFALWGLGIIFFICLDCPKHLPICYHPCLQSTCCLHPNPGLP